MNEPTLVKTVLMPSGEEVMLPPPTPRKADPVPQTMHERLALVEEGLVLALRLPAWLPEEALDSEAARALFLGQSYTDLSEWAHKTQFTLSGMLASWRTGRTQLDLLNDHFVLSVETWAGRARHAERRRQYIEALIDLRAAILERMKVIPTPGTVVIEPAPWGELSPRQQKIVSAVARAGKSIAAKEVATILGEKSSNIARDLAALTTVGILQNPSKQGYSILRTPDGSPNNLYGDSSPNSSPSDKPASD